MSLPWPQTMNDCWAACGARPLVIDTPCAYNSIAVEQLVDGDVWTAHELAKLMREVGKHPLVRIAWVNHFFTLLFRALSQSTWSDLSLAFAPHTALSCESAFHREVDRLLLHDFGEHDEAFLVELIGRVGQEWSAVVAHWNRPPLNGTETQWCYPTHAMPIVRCDVAADGVAHVWLRAPVACTGVVVLRRLAVVWRGFPFHFNGCFFLLTNRSVVGDSTDGTQKHISNHFERFKTQS